MNNEKGLSLVEITISAVVLATASMGVAATMMTGLAANRVYRENTLVLARGQHYLETMFNLQIGTSADAAADDDDLDVVFSGDPEIGQNPPSLYALAKKIDTLPGFFFEFTPPNLGFAGSFLVRVTNNVASILDYPPSVDADGDGVPDSGVASMTEGTLLPQFIAGCYEDDDSDDGRELFAIEVFYRAPTPVDAVPRLVLRGFRAQDL